MSRSDEGATPPRRWGLIIALAVIAVLVLGGGIAWYSARQATRVELPNGQEVDLADVQRAAKEVGDAAERINSGEAPPIATTEALTAYLPATAAGFSRGAVKASTHSAAGVEAAEVEAEYAKGSSRLKLKVADVGGAGALASVASAIGIDSSKETATGYEKMGMVNGRMTQESYDRSRRSGEYSVLVGERFMVQARGDGVTMDELKAAVDAVGLSRLEAAAKAG